MKDRKKEVGERFAKDVADHGMTVVKEDGLYRHLRFQKPGTWCYGFDVVTWPGFLAVTGDMGEYLFSRVQDMLTFFRGEEISVGYWAEKCLARGREGVDEWCSETFIENVWQDAHNWMDAEDGTLPKDFYDAVKKGVVDRADDGMHEAVSAAMNFEWKGDYPFQDFYEHRNREYTHQFLWVCHAIPWAIARYDAFKKGE